MASRFSVLFLVFGILNILVAIGPPCAGCVGVNFFLKRPEGMLIRGRDVGPQMMAHIDKNATGAKAEAFTAVGCNWFVALLLVAGAIGLFVGHEWGRWLSVGAGLLMILTLCLHDIYQFAVLRPAIMTFLDQNLPMPPGPEREGFKIGFTSTMFLWTWINPLLMLYLAAMCITLALNAVLRRAPDDEKPERRRRRRDRDDYDDD